MGSSRTVPDLEDTLMTKICGLGLDLIGLKGVVVEHIPGWLKRSLTHVHAATFVLQSLSQSMSI